MSKKPISKKYGLVGISGLQFHVWRNSITFSDDHYGQLENMLLTFVPVDSSIDATKALQYAVVDAAAEMFKTSRGVWSHNSRIYVLALWVPEDGIGPLDDTVDLSNIEYDDVSRVYEIHVTPDLIRVGSMKCMLDDDTLWQSNFITRQEACSFLEKYRSCPHDYTVKDMDASTAISEDRTYYLDPIYVSLDAISVKNSAAAGTTLLQDIVDKTRYALPKETPEQMKFPAYVSSLHARKSCCIDVMDMLHSYTMQDIKNRLHDVSAQQLIVEWAIAHYVDAAHWYISEVMDNDRDYGDINIRNWPVSCDFLEKNAFIAHMEELNARRNS